MWLNCGFSCCLSGPPFNIYLTVFSLKGDVHYIIKVVEKSVICDWLWLLMSCGNACWSSFHHVSQKHVSLCEMCTVLSKSTETMLTFCLYEVTQCLKVKRETGSHFHSSEVDCRPHWHLNFLLVIFKIHFL